MHWDAAYVSSEFLRCLRGLSRARTPPYSLPPCHLYRLQCSYPATAQTFWSSFSGRWILRFSNQKASPCNGSFQWEWQKLSFLGRLWPGVSDGILERHLRSSSENAQRSRPPTDLSGLFLLFKWLTETRVSISFISLFLVKGNFSSIFQRVSIHLVVKQSSLTMGTQVIYCQASFLFAREIPEKAGWKLCPTIFRIISGSVIFRGCQPQAPSMGEGSPFGEDVMIPECWLTGSWSVLLLCSIYQSLWKELTMGLF